ncbi:MAG: hypothetical protein ABIK15_12550 [Pseudomonadota bacterium]
MRIDLMKKLSPKDHLGCFGNFDIEDNICRKFCILNLRCAIENDKNSRMELLEDLLSVDNLNERLQ